VVGWLLPASGLPTTQGETTEATDMRWMALGSALWAAACAPSIPEPTGDPTALDCERAHVQIISADLDSPDGRRLHSLVVACAVGPGR
jgi:hypothetical protein